MLEKQDYKDILEVLDIAYSSQGLTSLRQSVMQHILNIFYADSGAFFLYNPDKKQNTASSMASLNFDDKYVKLYQRHFCKCDPVYDAISQSINPVFRCTDIMPYNQWLNLEYYNDFLKPQKLHWEMHCCLKYQQEPEGIISFLRPKERSNFSDKEITKAQLLSYHIAIALHNLTTISHARELQKSTAGISEGWQTESNSHHLTRREMEIIEYIATGLTNKELADKLFISIYTIEAHLKNIFKKMKVRNRTELIGKIRAF